jgi:DNA processing protein
MTASVDGVRETHVSRWLPRSDSTFPSRLNQIQKCPDGIWLRCDRLVPGDIWNAPSVAIVGSRAASAAGLEISRNLAWELAAAGVVVVSGLARGIDGAAHEGALLAGGVTVAVLATGVERIYPAEHGALARKICRQGAVISEWGGDAKPLAWRFPLRNRLISGLADLVIMVEAEARSGAHHTISYALSQGRLVMAVPRDPVFPGALGPNRLLAEGAAPAVNAETVLNELQLQISPTVAVESPPVQLPDETGDPLRTTVIQLLGKLGPLTIDQLIGRVGGESIPNLSAVLLRLEISGTLRRDGTGRYRLVRGV